MERKSKITIGKAAAVLGAIPLLLWAYEYGPNPGYSGVPNENGTCTAAGCHTGTTNDPANKGSVKINFPNGTTYTPGVAQHLTVTISDPAATQTAWGFQLTPRVASSTTTVAGTMTPTDQNTLLMCSAANFFVFQTTCMSGGDTGSQLPCNQHQSVPACPASFDNQALSLQYIEHSYSGYVHTMGTGSGTYQFTWTPPATNVGNITFYIAGNAGVGGPPTQNGDHIYATTYTVTPGTVTPPSPPAVTNAISASGFGAFTSVASGSYIEVYGSNLAPAGDTRTWLAGDFTGNNAPTSLDGTKVTIGGQPAYVSFISPGQVNAQVPSGVGTGSQPVVVTTTGGASTAYSINVNALEPGLLAPSSFLVGSKQYVVAQHLDGTFVLPINAISGVTSRPATVGETVTIYGVGFGAANSSSNQAIPFGQIVTVSNTLVNQVQMQMGSQPASLSYQGLAPSLVGAYQFNLVVPSGLSGDQPLTFTQNNTKGTQTLFLSVQ
jgi:uncharacterized protein (TIGR03437 family)